MENLNLALVSSPKPLFLGHSSSKNVFTRRKPFAFGTFRVSANSSSSHVTRAASKSHQNLKSVQGKVTVHTFASISSSNSQETTSMLSCRVEVQSELLQQVLLFMLQNKHLGMVQVCEFLKPLLDFSIIRLLGSESPSSSFGLQLVSSMASFCCSCPSESMPVLMLLMECLKYLPHETSEDYRKLVFVVEHMVEAYIVVLKSLAGEKLLIAEVQLHAVEFLGTVLSLLTCLQWHSGGYEPIIELSRRLCSVQKDLGLQWEPGLSTIMASLFTILVQSELEHEQISISKLLLLILKWKYDKDDAIATNTSSPFEEVLFLLPFVSLMSSPSKYVKALATDLLLILEKLLLKMLVAVRHKPIIDEETHYLSTPGIIVLRLLRHLWYQDGESSSRISLLNLALKGTHENEVMHDKPISWASHLRGFCLSIVERRKSTSPLLLPQELFLTETPLLSAVLSVLLIHPSMGAAAVDSLSSIAIMDPKLGVPLLLAIMFYTMTPLVVQTILPMLNRDAKGSLYATGTRLLCRTWEINDRAFGSLQGVLLPKGFTDFTSDRAICISLAASIRDVCHKSPDRGVDLILTVSSCIECQDPIVKALGLQSLVHLCEADVIDFYTAWDVIAKHVQGYKGDPIIAHSTCLLLRWGAMDAEAYPEASKSVLLNLWDLVTSSHGTKWEKTKIAALEALIQYEVAQLEKNVPDFKKMNLELFFSETSPTVLKVMEDFHVKIITYEHMDWNHPLMVDVHLSLATVLEIMELQGGQIRLCYDRDN
ncbi:unnamed protein product [Vicia faba]|uniref:DUF3730 domain-containing protein n=1 Tax=Vicia faba TaxID=3906 RepID=A0AAV0ZN03_VICFA|nr:unnamed protein product [Vicia faba]